MLGGAFSEGVDLPGSRLIGAIIIGVGLPGLSNERNIIRDYFDEDTGVGYDYAYTYPGMNNVLQAAGRVIRTDADRLNVFGFKIDETEDFKSSNPINKINIEIIKPEIYSIRPWPKGCSGSGFFEESLNPKI